MKHEEQQAAPVTFVTTADGSKTLYNAAVGENYHSRHGALQESRHVFLHAGLQHFMDIAKADQVSILEVGFGTGLNFILSAEHCINQNINLQYTGIEAYPLSQQMISETGYGQYVSPLLWQQYLEHYDAALEGKVQMNVLVNLWIAHQKLMQFGSEQRYDVIYFDAFAALHQPDMWNEAAINHTASFLKTGGVFVTYAITGNLKRMLKGLGFKVEKAPGAPGKREMLRAVKVGA